MQKAVDASFDIDFDLSVISAVCREYKKWKSAGNAPECVGFKISEEMFFSENFTEKLSEITSKFGVDPSVLEIQVDEITISRHPHRSRNAFSFLKKLGFKSSIDNFGLGVSAFAQLKTLAVNKYRLDKSITQNVVNDYYHSLLAQVAVDISHQTDKIIVASGIINEEQNKYFIARNYDILQGEYIYPAIPSEMISDIIKN
jgi:EAL domain-containing protein (putative c-di-GMP-specific phosphodiesterase class I)